MFCKNFFIQFDIFNSGVNAFADQFITAFVGLEQWSRYGDFPCREVNLYIVRLRNKLRRFTDTMRADEGSALEMISTNLTHRVCK